MEKNIDDTLSNSKKRGSICLEPEIDKELKSPEHKKQKEQVTEVDIVKQGNMKTLSPSEMATKTLIACNTIILSELLNDAEENQIEKYGIKKLLECFNPLIENEIEQMKKHMFEYSGYELDNILTYKSAIEFVTNNDKDDITETDLGELAEILIAAIKNRMTKYCEDCKNWYSVHRKDKPNRECVMCKVGQHDCSTEKNEKKRSGDKWFCFECNGQFTNQNKQNKCRNIFFKGFEENDETKSIINETIEKLRQKAKSVENDTLKNLSIDDEDLEPEKEGEKSKEEEEENKKKNEDNSDKKKNEGIDSNKGNSKNTGTSGNGSSDKRTKCKYFLSSYCRFGNKCRNYHPDVCKEWSTKGACANINEDQQCKLAHPPKCRMFECHRNNCKYLHPTNISKRKQDKPPMNRPQYQDRRFNENQKDRDFLDNSWPLPREASMNIHQIMAQMYQRMNEWDTRWERMERSRTNRWGYY